MKQNDQDRFWMERLYLMKQIPFHVYNPLGELINVVGVDKGEEDPLKTDPRIFFSLYQKWKEKRHPLLEMEDDWIIYLAFADECGNFYIGGPGCMENSQQKMYEYKRKHNLSKKFMDMSRMLPTEAANLLSIMLGIWNNQYMEEIELLKLNGLSKSKKEELEWDVLYYQFEEEEKEKEHLNYEYERQMLDVISEGRVEKFDKKSYVDMNAMEKIGKMAESEKKQIEYMTASAITLIGRAAIKGGIPVSEMYAVTEVYFQKLEKCTNAIDMIKLNVEVQETFTRLVRKNKDQKKEIYYIEECKNLIARSIHKRITVEEIAQQIGINRTYLSTRFSAIEGMTISQYSIRVRLKAAENMLKYSDMTISQIAEYFCFTSQSYFGKMFKEKNGITPVEFRQQYKVVDFKNRHN